MTRALTGLLTATLLAVGCDGARAAGAPPAQVSFQLQDGDLVFQRSRSAQSAAVAAATRSEYTHMGIVLVEDGKPMVLEAVQPTRLTPFHSWVARGEEGRVVVKRLENAGQVFTPAVRARMRQLGRSWLGKSYDLQFQWSDDRLYCSELVYKLLDRAAGVHVGKLQKAREFDLASPEVRKKLDERFGKGKGDFNPEEPVISPQSMFDDPKLVTVFSPP
jgi:hypothetical protein